MRSADTHAGAEQPEPRSRVALRRERLRSHRLTAPAATVLEAAQHMLAVQSQDFTAGRWALAVRTRGRVTLSAVDRAFDDGDLVRAWTMRGTLHTIPARDLTWLLSITGARQSAPQGASRDRALGIDDEVLAAALRVIRPVLLDGGCTRAEAFARWTAAGIDPREQRGVHLLGALAMRGEICQGPVAEATSSGIRREQRFVLVDRWIREHARPSDPLAEFFVRYVEGHGPAGASDFAWWSGLPLGTAREAAARAAPRLAEIDEGLFVGAIRPRRSPAAPSVVALGAFDEYYISYADRTDVCSPEHLAAVGPGKNGMVRAVVVAEGRVVGVWRMPSTPGARRAGVPVAELFPPVTVASDEVSAAMRRYADFLERG
ncbi:winged helix DNA-binding domain-containing protein [Microbacterium sp. 179-I 3D4 NHS]|uniref:winged helix DNA-binding domain-containing protein n=1 Tax=Microbacterium sp. 179-I 3D4 NHS TaxID=3142381 RepID=UPI00399F2328